MVKVNKSGDLVHVTYIMRNKPSRGIYREESEGGVTLLNIRKTKKAIMMPLSVRG